MAATAAEIKSENNGPDVMSSTPGTDGCAGYAAETRKYLFDDRYTRQVESLPEGLLL